MDKLHSTDGFACTPERLDAALRPAANDDDPSAPPEAEAERQRGREAEPKPKPKPTPEPEPEPDRCPSVMVARRRRLLAARLLTHGKARQGVDGCWAAGSMYVQVREGTVCR